ncbi:MAG: dienelactone hydrolase family protein [Gemmatimonadetes bacterium]|nr:dienelactone hydrolase family protein [Gemmatimonadota bacterium]
MARHHRELSTLLTLVFVACSAPGQDGSTGEAGASTTPDGPRIALAPTAPDQLPPAIVGQGGDLQGTNVQYLPSDPATIGYLAVPQGAGPFPALVIVHEWNGLVDRVRQVADDFAAEGYVTLAVDLFSGQTGTNPEENMALVRTARGDMPKVITNLDAAVAYLKARPDVTGRVGAMGWCFGGGIALSFGLDGTQHDATAIFYGALVDDPGVLARMSHEVYGTFARLDTGPSPEQVAAFETAARAAGIANDLHIYDEVGHGFWLHVDEDPAVRTAPALDAWNRLKAYLGRTLG